MIEPRWKDDAFLADVAVAREEARPRQIHFWWLGQSGFLLMHAGDCLLFDPYLSDSLTMKYAATDKPHVRMTARVVDPARLGWVQVVTSSHNHTDHFDPDTLRPLLDAAAGAKLVLPAANLSLAESRLGPAYSTRYVPLNEGRSTTIGAFRVDAVPAAHEELSPSYLGFVVSVGAFRVYHSGDTVLFPGMEERLRPYAVDVALLPINGRAPERRVSGNLDGPEAARLAHAIGARWVVPCHYEMFTFNTASPDAFRAECSRIGQRYEVLRAGERWTVEAVE